MPPITDPKTQTPYDTEAEIAEAMTMLEGAGCIICGKPGKSINMFSILVQGKTRDVHFDCVDWLYQTAEINAVRRGMR